MTKPTPNTLATIGRRAATTLRRKKAFSTSYVWRVLKGERGKLDGRNARAILDAAKKVETSA